ncbi:hypothetical protein H6P81_016228 [Aristolochia fimbriata]|uniref:Uncharacterized protein n=1 Tax=Aristolochia fimbriata TaxID=158543 RepID=A0AAV7ECB8_ARIFI|nr:hypothetical protein H6P81_016228 [Aristolochia fimbriata]
MQQDVQRKNKMSSHYEFTFEKGGQMQQDVLEPIVVKELQEKVRGWRAYVKEKHYNAPDKEARKDCQEPKVTQEQWNKHIEYWSTEANVKVDEKNKENRAHDRLQVANFFHAKDMVDSKEKTILFPVLDEVFGRHHGGYE